MCVCVRENERSNLLRANVGIIAMRYLNGALLFINLKHRNCTSIANQKWNKFEEIPFLKREIL